MPNKARQTLLQLLSIISDVPIDWTYDANTDDVQLYNRFTSTSMSTIFVSYWVYPSWQHWIRLSKPLCRYVFNMKTTNGATMQASLIISLKTALVVGLVASRDDSNVGKPRWLLALWPFIIEFIVDRRICQTPTVVLLLRLLEKTIEFVPSRHEQKALCFYGRMQEQLFGLLQLLAGTYLTDTGIESCTVQYLYGNVLVEARTDDVDVSQFVSQYLVVPAVAFHRWSTNQYKYSTRVPALVRVKVKGGW